MAIEGIWTGEVYGPFGWENRGVFILEDGRLLGGDNRQTTAGRYRFSGRDMTAELTIHYYGPPRTVFGEAVETFTSIIEGALDAEGGVIDGTIRRPDKPQYELQLRLTKRMDLPNA